MEKDVQQQDPERDEPRQTTPKGYEIPVPSRKQVFDAFRKIARAKKRP